MRIDLNWLYAVAGLVLGFVLNVLFDELKVPRLIIIGEGVRAFSISWLEISIMPGFDKDFAAYRVRVENRQKRYLNGAADNCVAWLQLDSEPEAYQLCWVGSRADVTINVGDTRELDLAAIGQTTGRIYSPTERGYFDPQPRVIGDGKSEISGKLRVTSRNGRKAERRLVIRPSAGQLKIILK